MASQAYQLTSVMTKGNEKDETLFSHMQLKPMTPEQLFDSLLTATAAHKAGTGDDGDQRARRLAASSSSSPSPTTRGRKRSSFQGTIPQALMMMNGELMEEAALGQAGQLPGRPPRAGRRHRPVAGALHGQLPLPGRPEPAPDAPRSWPRRGSISKSFPDTLQVLQDLFWALLNSNEFILNH